MSMMFLCGCSAEKKQADSRGMDCISSRRMVFKNFSEDEIRIVLNKDCMDDPVNVAKEIVQKYQENDFHSFYFSSTSDKIIATVYLEKDSKKPVLEFEYDVIHQVYENIVSNQ